VSQGICFVAMGSEYDRLAAHTIAYSRKFIKCGITVLTNLKERDAKWLSVPDVNFLYLDISTNENRRVKIDLHKYSPYDETLYMDVDSIVIKHGIEKIFDFLKGKDIVFQQHTYWDKGKKYARLYRDTLVKLGVTLPLRVVLGGFWAFRKTPQTVALFEQWKKNWIAMGCGRDMPSLACAIKQTGIAYNYVLRDREKLFSFGVKYDCIAIHRVKSDDLKKYGIPVHKQNKPFDVSRSDWDKVSYDEQDGAEAEFYCIKNGDIEVYFSKQYGGTIRRILHNGVDIGVKRSGCEYWCIGDEHYEQEYGNITSFKAINVESIVRVDISATMVSPITKETGGRCDMVIEIHNSGKITSRARIFPNRAAINYDQYYCFYPDVFKEYCHDRAEFKPISNPVNSNKWWYHIEHKDSGEITVKNAALAVTVSADKKLTDDVGIHKSENIMEIKCKDYDVSRISEFCEMTLEKA
jgi:hypothetical protein